MLRPHYYHFSLYVNNTQALTHRLLFLFFWIILGSALLIQLQYLEFVSHEIYSEVYIPSYFIEKSYPFFNILTHVHLFSKKRQYHIFPN